MMESPTVLPYAWAMPATPAASEHDESCHTNHPEMFWQLPLSWFFHNLRIVNRALVKRIDFIDSFDVSNGESQGLPPLPIAGKQITPESFQLALTRFDDAVENKAEGYFGTCPPVVKEVLAESCSMMAGLTAALSQLAHPFVAYAIKQHSYTKGNPMLRFYNTFKYVFGITFGSFEEGLLASKTVASIHRKIQGTIEEEAGAYPKGFQYSATDEAAAIWVGATLTDYSVFMFEMMRRPLSDEEKEEIFAHYRRLSVVWGIDPSSQPLTWRDFQIYNARMYNSDILTVTAPARHMFEIIVNPLPWERWVGLSSTRLTHSVLVPSRVAKQYGLHPSRASFVCTVVLLAVIRSVYALLPSSLRTYTRYNEWVSRKNGLNGRLNLLQRVASAFGGWFVDSYLQHAGEK